MADQDNKEDFFLNDRGVKIFSKHWSKNAVNSSDSHSFKALLFITHGLAEHCLYYDEIAERMSQKGFYVFSHDHEGHGQSEGKRNAVTDIRHYIADVFKHIDSVKEKFPSLPVFVIGHSMGGCITVLAGLDRPDYFKGVILIGPVITPDPEAAGRVRIFMGKMVARVFPQMPVMWLDPNLISHDEAQCLRYKNDPLVYHGGMKACTGVSILNACIEIESKLDSIKWPFLIIHGGEDKIVPPNGSKCMHEKATSQDKTILVMDKCYHQPHTEAEPIKSEALQTIQDWLEKRLD